MTLSTTPDGSTKPHTDPSQSTDGSTKPHTDPSQSTDATAAQTHGNSKQSEHETSKGEVAGETSAEDSAGTSSSSDNVDTVDETRLRSASEGPIAHIRRMPSISEDSVHESTTPGVSATRTETSRHEADVPTSSAKPSSSMQKRHKTDDLASIGTHINSPGSSLSRRIQPPKSPRRIVDTGPPPVTDLPRTPKKTAAAASHEVPTLPNVVVYDAEKLGSSGEGATAKQLQFSQSFKNDDTVELLNETSTSMIETSDA